MEYSLENLLALYAEGLSQSQIAKQLNVTRGVVNGKLSRMKRKQPHLLPVRKVAPKPKLEKPKPKANVVALQNHHSNRCTFRFKPHNKEPMSKADMQAMLKEAVENTK